MKTMIIEYNERNASVKHILDGLVSSKRIRIKKSSKEQHLEELEEAVRQTETMMTDIRRNATEGYQTMDEFLKTIRRTGRQESFRHGSLSNPLKNGRKSTLPS
jgi:uncharacterized damage-inducible protein DinB